MASPYLKALAAVVVSAVGALVTALGPGDMNLGDISNRGWLEAALVVLASGGLVWFVENVPGCRGRCDQGCDCRAHRRVRVAGGGVGGQRDHPVGMADRVRRRDRRDRLRVPVGREAENVT